MRAGKPGTATAPAEGATLGEICERFGLELRGDRDHRVRGVASLPGARSDQLSFLASPGFRRYLTETRAGAVILDPASADGFAGNALLHAAPYAAYARVASWLCGQPPPTAGIHATASVDPGARLGEGVSIGPGCVIGADCELGSRAILGPGTIVERGARVGADCHLVARVWIGPGVCLGERVRAHPGAVLGSDGFGMAWDDGRWHRVPQLGGLVIGDDCEIGANTTIDRGTIEDTVLGDDVKLDNQIQIAHNVRIGAHTAVAACTGIAGSSEIGAGCLIGGACRITGHVKVADGVQLMGGSNVTHSIREAQVYGSAFPAQPRKQWQKNMARLRRLDESIRRLSTAGKDKERKSNE